MPMIGKPSGVHRETRTTGGKTTSVIKSVTHLTPGQKRYITAIKDNRLVFCMGPAGTGKSHVAAGMAAEALKNRTVEKILCVRPAIGAGDPMGFLPGTQEEKLAPYLRPILIEVSQYFTPADFKKYKTAEDPIVIIEAVDFMRGLTFHNSFIIVDEAQNCTFEQLKMIITRMGSDTKMVIEGDESQSDLPPAARGAFEEFADRWIGRVAGVAKVEMTNDDIVRDPFLKELMIKWDPRPFEYPIDAGPEDDVAGEGDVDLNNEGPIRGDDYFAHYYGGGKDALPAMWS